MPTFHTQSPLCCRWSQARHFPAPCAGSRCGHLGPGHFLASQGTHSDHPSFKAKSLPITLSHFFLSVALLPRLTPRDRTCAP